MTEMQSYTVKPQNVWALSSHLYEENHKDGILLKYILVSISFSRTMRAKMMWALIRSSSLMWHIDSWVINHSTRSTRLQGSVCVMYMIALWPFSFCTIGARCRLGPPWTRRSGQRRFRGSTQHHLAPPWSLQSQECKLIWRIRSFVNEEGMHVKILTQNSQLPLRVDQLRQFCALRK